MHISRRDFTTLLASALCLPPAADALAKTGGLSAAQVRAADGVIQELVRGSIVPGASYSIGNAAETLALGAHGLRELQPSAAMLASTRCALASVSKQFASAAAYYLRDSGRLSLDEPISRYVPALKFGDRMTLRQVMTMRAGVPANDELCEAEIQGKMDAGTLIANLNKHPLDFPPGRYFSYSNCEYDLLGVVISMVSGMAYSAFIRDRVFKPLGMTSSYVLGEQPASDFARGYARETHGWRSEPASRADAVFASGNLVSTAADMQRWNRSLLNATLLSRKTIEEMFTIPTSGGTAHTNYASGWFVEPSGVVWHGGSLAGYGTVNMLVPKTGYAITILSNTSPSPAWRPEQAAREVYNRARLGPALPPFLPRVRSTVPQ